jgi:hypothetical protein
VIVKLAFRDEAPMSLYEAPKRLERLRLERDLSIAAGQAMSLDIEREIAEPISPRGRRCHGGTL